MNEHELTQGLQHSASEVTAKTRFCPDENVLVSYFEGKLEGDRLASLGRHVVDCRFCQGQLGNLARDTEPEPEVSGTVLAEAKQFGTRRQAEPLWHVRHWAAAAVLVVALFVTFSDYSTVGTNPDVAPMDTAVAPGNRQLRSVNHRIELQVLNPTPGASIAAGSLLRWAEIPGSIHYDILVLSSTGDVLLTQRLTEAEWQLDAHPGLATGDRYYLRVIAYLADGRTVNSRHIEFRLAEAE